MGLERASALYELQAAIEALRTSYSVDHMIYHWVNAKGAETGVGTYEPAWVETYRRENYIRVDPVILGCAQAFHPMDWKQLDWSSKAARQFQADAIAHGVGNQGLSIPIRGPNGQYGLFTVSHSADDQAWAEFIETHRRDLILIAHYFNQKAIELEPERVPETTQPLSPRELETLTLLAVGYNRAQIARTLNISEHTLRVYVESARFKLGAMNTTHAVANALTRGLIIL